MKRETKQSPLPRPDVSLFARLTRSSMTPEKFQKYRELGHLRWVEPGETIIAEGQEPGGPIFLIASGTVTLTRGTVPLTELGEGQWLGDMDLFLWRDARYGARAASRCEVLPITPDRLVMMLRNTDVGTRLLGSSARRVSDIHDALVHMRTAAAEAHELLDELRKSLAAKEREQAEAETRARIALANLEAADARIRQLEGVLRAQEIDVAQDGTIGRTFLRPMAEPPAAAADDEIPLDLDLDADLDADLDLLAPPAEPAPPPPQPIAKVALRRVAVQEVPPSGKKPRVDETIGFETGQGSRGTPVGARTQAIAAFDPDKIQVELTVDDQGTRISAEPPAPQPHPPDVDDATDALIKELSREILAMPDATPKK